MRSSSLRARHWALPLLWLAALGCPINDPRTTTTVGLLNNLVVPITVTIKNNPDEIIGTDQVRFLTWLASKHSFTWTPRRLQFPEGAIVPNDLTGETVDVDRSDLDMQITNVVAGKTYFSPLVINTAGADVDVAVVDNGTVRCLGQIAPTTSGFRFGYYVSGPTTEMRWYRGGTACTGASVTWDHVLLASAEGPSGSLQITANRLP